MDILRFILNLYFYFVLVYFVLVSVTYAAFMIISYLQILHHMRHNSFCDYRSLIQSELTPPISILAPAYNEEATIIESVKSLLKLNYGRYEVVVVNDGSKDDTISRVVKEFGMFKSKQVYKQDIAAKPVRAIYRSLRPEYKNLTVVDKENGGKADALNVGINVATYDHVCCIDADSLLEDDALLKVVKPFLEDPQVVAAGGIVRIANGCEVANGRVIRVELSSKLLPTFQVVEYLRAFLSGRMSWHGLNGLLIISGAFGLFKKSVVLEVGGYNHNTIGEDMELVTRIHRAMKEKRRPYRIVFVPDPVCWTEVPETVKILSRQRNRWQRGLMDTLLLHWKMIFNPQYGIVGVAAMPHFLFFEALGPIVEGVGYAVMIAMLVLGTLQVDMAILFFIVALYSGMMFSVGAVLLEEVSFQRYHNARDVATLLALGVLENFGYRQITTWWRFRGIVDFFRGKKGWGSMQRKGFGAK